MSGHPNTFPKLHNAAWPGVVGKGEGSEPPIPLETMLDLTAAAEVDGVKFDGVDLFLFAPHVDIDSSDDDLKSLAEKVRSRGLTIGSVVAPVWPPTGGGSSMDEGEGRTKFLEQVRKGCRIARTLRELGVRPYGVVRIDSACGPGDWANDPSGSQAKIAQTFKEAGKIAHDHGERLAAEGEICWGGMHSWRKMVDLLERVSEPDTVGFQADMAHTLLYTLGENAPEDRLLPADYDWKDKSVLDDALRVLTDALRPWTIDFHVAQNDATVFGSGSHDHTGRHCLPNDPNGKLDIPHVAGFWMRDKSGNLTKNFQHICWDGCMFPNAVMSDPKTWTDILASMIQVRTLTVGRRESIRAPVLASSVSLTLPTNPGVDRMSAKKPLNIGLVGYGFMGRTHSNGYKRVNDFFDVPYRPVLKGVCGRSADNAKAFAENWGYESIETDWRKLVERPDIDAIDICTPNNSHAEIAIAAAGAGKMVLCEKPLSMNLVEGQAMVEAIEKAGVPNTVWYNYRRVPAVTLAKNLIDEGKLGRIFHYRANFLQDWTISADVPQGGAGLWRLDAAAAGSGVTGDLLAHCIDTALWLNGHITTVSAMTETFVKERKHTLTGKIEPVGIDDACAFLCRFENGSLGLFESTRYARGHKALYTFEINGEKGSLKWDLHDLHRLEWFNHGDPGNLRGWRSIHVTDGDHPYMKNWWVPGLQIGYEHTFVHQVADFLVNLAEGKSTSPTFREALATQAVCDAVLDSAEVGQWQSVVPV